MTFDVDAFLDEREAHTASCRIVRKNHLADEIARLEDEVVLARRLDESENRAPQAPKIAKQIEALRQDMEASSVEFVFEEIPAHIFDALVNEVPPSKDDKAEGAAWSPDKFPPLLLAAASKEPKLDREQARKLWRGLPKGEQNKLWLAAFGIQTRVGRIPLAVSGTGTTPTTGTSSDTAPQEESPEADS